MLEGFIEHLTIYLDKVNSKATTVSFIRHAKTPLNDGSFLGIGRDPSILGFEQEVIPKTVFDKIYTSNLKRSQETAAYLSGDCIINSYLLNEINYGLAEGITFNEISLKFPDIAKGWLKKEDPNFPEGECQKDVEKRLNEFITEELISSEAQDIAVVTHLVIIRVLLAKFYNAPISNWFHIRPEHLEDLQCLVFNKKLVPSLSDAQRIKYRDQLQLWNQE